MPHMLALPAEQSDEGIKQFLEEDYPTNTMEQNIAAVFKEAYRCLKVGGEIRFASLEEDFYIKPGVEVSFDEDSIMDLKTINAYQNKRVAIIKKVLADFASEYKVFVVYKDTGLIVIKKV